MCCVVRERDEDCLEIIIINLFSFFSCIVVMLKKISSHQ